MGAIPTTRTMAGIASGSRHRNRRTLHPGTRRYVQVIVGMSSRSIPRTVSAAISSETTIAEIRFSSSAIASRHRDDRAPARTARGELQHGHEREQQVAADQQQDGPAGR